MLFFVIHVLDEQVREPWDAELRESSAHVAPRPPLTLPSAQTHPGERDHSPRHFGDNVEAACQLSS